VKRVLRWLVVIVAVWIAALFVFGFILADRTGKRVASRVATTLQAEATFEDVDLGLVGGSLSLEKLRVRRDDIIGKLALDVGAVHCDLPPLGLALVDRTCGELEIRDVTLELSTLALFKLKKPKRTPFRADRVVVENAKLAFEPLPGFGRVAIAIERGEAGPTVFKTPLSFLFALRSLRASVELPAGGTLRIDYADGKLRAAGGVLGSTPVELPIALPVITSTDDAQAEIAKLVAFGKDLAERLVAQKAEDWLRKRIPLP
jgi:hypothetical protein